jgi:hypothetical protein
VDADAIIARSYPPGFFRFWPKEFAMPDNLNSQFLTMSQATRSLPGNVSICTLHRWRLNGVRGVKLVTVLIGGRRFVSRDELNLFIARTTAAADGKSLPTKTPAARRKAIDRARKDLEAAGI